MAKFFHHADYTCLAQAGAFDAAQKQLERYTFPFVAKLPDAVDIKDAIRGAVVAAIESRKNRGTNLGRLHVEIDEECPGSGRVVDHIARIEEIGEPIVPPKKNKFLKPSESPEAVNAPQ